VERIRLEFALGVETEFVDRDRALAQVVKWAERGTWAPFVIFGPEGCGKTAFLGRRLLGCGSLGTTSSTYIRWIGSSRLRWMIPTSSRSS